MLSKILKKYADNNPEKFNKEFIRSRSDKNILDFVKDIFKSLEIIKEVEVVDVSLETDESSFGSIIKFGGKRKSASTPLDNVTITYLDEKAYSASTGIPIPPSNDKTKERESFVHDVKVWKVTNDPDVYHPCEGKPSDMEKEKFDNVHYYYKSVLPSRLNRIKYTVRLYPESSTEINEEPLLVETEKAPIERNPADATEITGYIYLDKLIDGCFYQNEGVRYYLIYQIVDNATYGIRNQVSLKSLLMPITLSKEKLWADVCLGKKPVEVNYFDAWLFSKRMNPVLYLILKEAYNELVGVPYKDKDTRFDERRLYQSTNLIDAINNYFQTDIKFSEDISELNEEGRLVFELPFNLSEREALPGDKGKFVVAEGEEKPTKVSGMLYFSISEKLLETSELAKAAVGCLLNLRIPGTTKKKRISFTYTQLTNPWFWIYTITGFFTKNNDLERRFEKARTILISMERLIDTGTRKALPLPDDDKKDVLTIMAYIMKEFEKLSKEDSMDLDRKRLRLEEYLLYPLRQYFSNQIYRVLNSSIHSKIVLKRIFSNLSPMSIIKSMITNELLRYYNSPNEINLYTSLMKFTYTGVQAINGKNVSNKQRDIHPSQTGRLSLIAASSSSPGLTGNIVPFCEVYDGGYFVKNIEKPQSRSNKSVKIKKEKITKKKSK